MESVCRGNSTVGSNPTLSAIRLRSRVIQRELRLGKPGERCRAVAAVRLPASIHHTPAILPSANDGRCAGSRWVHRLAINRHELRRLADPVQFDQGMIVGPREPRRS